MAITNIINCANQTPALKGSDCAFVPHKITKIIGLAKSVSFDLSVDNLDDNTFTNLVQCGKMWSAPVEITTNNSTEAQYESIEGLDKKTANGIVDFDFPIRCLSMCQLAEIQKVNSSWNIAFVITNVDCKMEKLYAATKADGTITGFSTNIFSVKNILLGTNTTSTTATLRVQFGQAGSKQFNSWSNVYDMEVDPCDYNVAPASILEVEAVTNVSNVVTVKHRIMEGCNNSVPIEGIGQSEAFLALYATGSSTYIEPTTTNIDATDPSIVTVTYDLNGSTVLGTNPFQTSLYDTNLKKPVVKVNDCFYVGTSGSFAI